MVLIGRRQLRSNNSWMHNLPALVKGKDRCTLQVHPDDAERLGLADGGRARVTSASGELVAPVEVTDEIMPGVVSIPHGWGHDVAGVRLGVATEHAGVNSNLLAPVEVDPPSGNAVLNGIPVEVVAGRPRAGRRVARHKAHKGSCKDIRSNGRCRPITALAGADNAQHRCRNDPALRKRTLIWAAALSLFVIGGSTAIAASRQPYDVAITLKDGHQVTYAGIQATRRRRMPRTSLGRRSGPGRRRKVRPTRLSVEPALGSPPEGCTASRSRSTTATKWSTRVSRPTGGRRRRASLAVDRAGRRPT